MLTDIGSSTKAAPHASRRKWRAMVWLLVRICISAGVIALMFHSIKIDDMRSRIVGIAPWAIATASAVIIAQIGLNSWRWVAISRHLDLRLPFPTAVRLYFEGLFFNQVLPSSVGGDVVRGMRLASISRKLRLSFESVLVDRITGVFSLAVLVLISLPVLFDYLREPVFRFGFPLVVVGAGAGMAALMSLPHLKAELRGLPIIRGFVGVGAKIAVVMLHRRSLFYISTALLSHILIGVIFWILALGSGIDLPLFVSIAMVPAAMLATLVPVSVAGWGLREGAIVTLLSRSGVSPEDALALSLGYGFLLLGLSLLGGPLWLMRGKDDEPMQAGTRLSHDG